MVGRRDAAANHDGKARLFGQPYLAVSHALDRGELGGDGAGAASRLIVRHTTTGALRRWGMSRIVASGRASIRLYPITSSLSSATAGRFWLDS